MPFTHTETDVSINQSYDRIIVKYNKAPFPFIAAAIYCQKITINTLKNKYSKTSTTSILVMVSVEQEKEFAAKELSKNICY